ncbi:hypothetical protein [Mesorhizobium sp. 128a]
MTFEDTTFQMYSPNRREQIGFVRRGLKKDGVFILLEKFKRDHVDEYLRREMQDCGYKARFFDLDEIKSKNELLLRTMSKNENTLAQISEALAAHFKYGCLTWNSGNFLHACCQQQRR